jgi:hypothetical protein
MSSHHNCATFLAAAGSFFVLGFIFQILLIKELHLQSAEQDILNNIENHLPFHLHSDIGSSHHDQLLRTNVLVPEGASAADGRTDTSTHDAFHSAPAPDDFSSRPAPPRTFSSYQPNASNASSSGSSGRKRRYYRDVIGEVPQIVKSWRAAELDWHDLLPQHMSSWERFGEKKGLRLLVSKEEQVTDYLTRFTESGLAAEYGQDHGPLLAYSGCNKLRSDCMIHPQSVCQTNGLCMWHPEQQLCVDFELQSPYGVQERGAPANGRVAKCPSSSGSRGVLSTEKGVLQVKEGERKCKVSRQEGGRREEGGGREAHLR